MIFDLAYDWNYFSFSFIRWRFVFQTKILGNFTESIFFVFLSDFDYSFIASLPSGSVCCLYISCILPADCGNPQWSPQRGRCGLGERGNLSISSISTMFDGGGGGLIERWACLIWGFRYQCDFLLMVQYTFFRVRKQKLAVKQLLLWGHKTHC